MYLLTLITQPFGKRKKNKFKEFSKIQDAIEYGQSTGKVYDIFDSENFRIIDWTEIHQKSEEGWVYNEQDLIWEKEKEGEDDFEED